MLSMVGRKRTCVILSDNEFQKVTVDNNGIKLTNLYRIEICTVSPISSTVQDICLNEVVQSSVIIFLIDYANFLKIRQNELYVRAYV